MGLRSEALCKSLRRVAFFAGQQPVDRFPDVVFSGFTHYACNGLAGFVEDDSSRDDIAQSETVEGVGVGSYPTWEVDVEFCKSRWDFGAILRVVDRDKNEADRLSGVRRSDLGQAGKFFL